MSVPYRLRVVQAHQAERELVVHPTQTLLQQLQGHGFDLPNACLNGNCGRCYARLLSGLASHTSATHEVPLCISRALSDLHLALPQAPQWQLYACQWRGQTGNVATLQLPAGKISLSRKQFALFTEPSATAATLLEQRQRLLTLQLHSPPSGPENHKLVRLLCVEADQQGRYQLRHKDQTVLTGLSAALAREIRESLLQSNIETTSER